MFSASYRKMKEKEGRQSRIPTRRYFSVDAAVEIPAQVSGDENVTDVSEKCVYLKLNEGCACPFLIKIKKWVELTADLKI